METKDFVETLNTDIESIDSVVKLSEFILIYIEECKQRNYKVSTPKFTLLIEKLLSAIQYHYPDEFSQGFKGKITDLALFLDEELTKSYINKYVATLLHVLSTISDSLPLVSLIDRGSFINVGRCSLLSSKLEQAILSIFTVIRTSKSQ